MATYETVKKEALALPAIQQDGLMKELAAQHVKRQAEAQAEKATGWKQKAWKAAAVIATLLAAVFGAVTVTGCTTAKTTTETAQDGTVTVTERSFTLNGSEAATLAKELVPIVKRSK